MFQLMLWFFFDINGGQIDVIASLVKTLDCAHSMRSLGGETLVPSFYNKKAVFVFLESMATG